MSRAVWASLEEAPTTFGSVEPWMTIGSSLLVRYLRGALEDCSPSGSSSSVSVARGQPLALAVLMTQAMYEAEQRAW
jgi:hypothetical protein